MPDETTAVFDSAAMQPQREPGDESNAKPATQPTGEPRATETLPEGSTTGTTDTQVASPATDDDSRLKGTQRALSEAHRKLERLEAELGVYKNLTAGRE